jgi:hypothetical protein
VRVLTPLLLDRPADPANVPPGGCRRDRPRRGRSASNVCSRSVTPALNPAGLDASPAAYRSEIPGACGRGNQHLGAFEGDRRVEPVKQGLAATQQDRDHVHADLIDQASGSACWMTVAPCRPTNLSPAALLACSIALTTPSVTNVYTGGCDVVGLSWVTTKHGYRRRGRRRPNHRRPHSCQIPCDPSRWRRRHRASPAGLPGPRRSPRRTSSRSIPAPSPNGFSRLSFGSVTYPSSEWKMSQITNAMSASSLCCPTGRSRQFSPTQTTPGGTSSSASHPNKARPSVLRPPHKTNRAHRIGKLATTGATGQGEP